ncbi:hypothetical protein F3J16_12445 [Burkholderia sp. Ap-962]|uniref:hypothetical protein n=1 Tax=Burkholderia sp. Ap-962 TaxID=2608333 RepID=UPI00141E82EB|nr:hypothetical protein [Burkholderia sp. Ap-962]NIF70989.1 hypothetical protein [Burkholderia sp. Ap-962]
MHESVARLLAAATKKDRNIVRLADLARALNKSEQVLNNWAYRGHGVSKEGRLLAQKVLGINATWIEEGRGPEFSADSAQMKLGAPAPGSGAQLPPEHNASPAALRLIDAIMEADKAGLSEEIFGLLLQTLRLCRAGDSPRNGRVRLEDPSR